MYLVNLNFKDIFSKNILTNLLLYYTMITTKEETTSKTGGQSNEIKRTSQYLIEREVIQ